MNGAGDVVITLGGKLPLDAGGAGCGQRADRARAPAAVPQGAAREPKARRRRAMSTVADDQARRDYVVTQVLEARERGVALRRQAVLFRSFAP